MVVNFFLCSVDIQWSCWWFNWVRWLLVRSWNDRRLLAGSDCRQGKADKADVRKLEKLPTLDTYINFFEFSINAETIFLFIQRIYKSNVREGKFEAPTELATLGRRMWGFVHMQTDLDFVFALLPRKPFTWIGRYICVYIREHRDQLTH